MKRKIPLTFNEISVLKSFGELPEASIPQLAVEARLTPTEMQETISKLEEKSLVKTYNGYFAKITRLGSRTLENWEFDLNESPRVLMPKPNTNQSNIHPQTALEREPGN